MSRHSAHGGLEFYWAHTHSPPPSYSPPPDYSMSNQTNERLPTIPSSSEMRGADVLASRSEPAMRVQGQERGSKTKLPKPTCALMRSKDKGQSPPMQYTEANFDLFFHPPTTSTLTSFIHWRTLLCTTLDEYSALRVRSISLMKCTCSFQHEYLNLEVDNTETRHTLTLLAHRDVSGKVKAGIAKDEVIFLPGRDESHPQTCCIRNISWKIIRDAPKLIHILRLLALTSSLMGRIYTAKRENCYRFVTLGFEAIRLFRPIDDFLSQMEEGSKGWKQGRLYGAKATDVGDVPLDVLIIIVQFYNGKMRYGESTVRKVEAEKATGVEKATGELTRGDKGKGKAVDEELMQEETRRGGLVRRHSV